MYVSNDSFDKEMTTISGAVGEEFVKRLLNDGILWKYEISEWVDSDIQSFAQTVFGAN